MNNCPDCGQRNPASLHQCAHCGSSLSKTPAASGFNPGFNAGFNADTSKEENSNSGAEWSPDSSPSSTYAPRNSDGVTQLDGPIGLIVGIAILGAVVFVFSGGIDEMMEARGKVAHYKVSVCDSSRNSAQLNRMREQGYQTTHSSRYQDQHRDRDRQHCVVKDFGPERPTLPPGGKTHVYYVDAEESPTAP